MDTGLIKTRTLFCLQFEALVSFEFTMNLKVPINWGPILGDLSVRGPVVLGLH